MVHCLKIWSSCNCAGNRYDIEYVKTQDGSEVDFFVRSKESGSAELIQVCWEMSDEKTFNRELKGLKIAMETFSISSGTIITWDDETTLDGNIQVIPVWKWLLN